MSCPNVARIGRIFSSTRMRRTRSALTIAFSVSAARFEIVVHQHIIVQAVIADFPGRIRQPPPNHFFVVLAARAKALFQDLTAKAAARKY